MMMCTMFMKVKKQQEKICGMQNEDDLKTRNKETKTTRELVIHPVVVVVVVIVDVGGFVLARA